MAAAVSLKLRDERFQPAIKMQVLIYPVTQGVDFQLPSYEKNSRGPILTRPDMTTFVNLYLDGRVDKVALFQNNSHISPSTKQSLAKSHFNVDRLPEKYRSGYTRPSLDYGDEKIWNEVKDKLMDPYFSPLVAESLTDLPMSYVFAAEHDPLRDDGMLYAARLREAGTKVKHVHSDIGVHGLMSFGVTTEAKDCLCEMTKFISENL